ncbi:MAG: hypothetical protein HYT30_00360 [Parcubacteria group bacterium]|nr:hypothetical protein [Parcubacteria group bacterium]
MKKNFWKIAACYLLIGILWSSFAAYKGSELHQYDADKGGPGAAVGTVLVNALGWPALLPRGVYLIATDSGKTSEQMAPVILPDIENFAVSLSCALPAGTPLVKKVYYLHEPGPEDALAENQWLSVVTDNRTGKKFAQWLIKSNGVWISSQYNWGLLYMYTPENGWKEIISRKEFVKETGTFSQKEKEALMHATCTRP